MGPSKSYEDLVREVYIEPLRSVLIIDDDYPTWDEILLSVDGGQGLDAPNSYAEKKWKVNPGPVRDVISALRSAESNLILDVDDGSKIDLATTSELIGNLHQTDLLILDYQLDRTSEDGTKAIKILRDIKANANFNLVVVQTAANLDKAFRDVLLALLAPCPDEKKDEKIATGLNLIGEAEVDHPTLLRDLRASFGLEQYLTLRQAPGAALSAAFRGQQPFAAFKQLCDDCVWRGATVRLVLEWAVFDFEDLFSEKMHDAEVSNLSWSIEGIKWIRSSTAFVAFTNKRLAADLIGDLQNALVAWAPPPTRLLLAKLRKELDDRGSVAEDTALGNSHVLARWYYELLKVDSQKQAFLIDETISRHTEQLISEVRPEVVKFSKAIIDHDKLKVSNGPKNSSALDVSIEKVVKSHFKIDLSDDGERAISELEHNAFICSARPSGGHLKTGHIFKIDDHYWVCLSPLCDLVPGQKNSGIFGEVGNRMPFLAVRFRRVEGDNLAKTFSRIKDDIQSNRYIFVKESGRIIILCLNEEGTTNTDSAPHWFPLYAGNQGVFSDDFRLKISKLANAENGRLVFKSHDVQVFSQLRYEYALNLMQKLGASMNRVGLDFSG